MEKMKNFKIIYVTECTKCYKIYESADLKIVNRNICESCAKEDYDGSQDWWE